MQGTDGFFDGFMGCLGFVIEVESKIVTLQKHVLIFRLSAYSDTAFAHEALGGWRPQSRSFTMHVRMDGSRKHLKLAASCK